MRSTWLFVLLFLPGAAAAGELTAAEIRSELVGQSISWWEEGGWFGGQLTLRPDGRAEIQVRTPRQSADQGRWTLEGNRICTVWPVLRAGSAKCYSVSRDASGRFVTSGGNVFELLGAGV